MQRLIKSGTLQAKLKIDQPGDKYEQEADRVADAVMRMPEPTVASAGTPHNMRAGPGCEEEELRRQPIEEEEEELQRQPIEEEEEELQAKATSGHISEVNPNLEYHIHSLKGGGQPLKENDRAFFEPRFGRDFSQIICPVHRNKTVRIAHNAKINTYLKYRIQAVSGGGKSLSESVHAHFE